MTYLMDADTFIRSKNEYYPFDLPPGKWFWALLESAHSAGLVASAEAIRDELLVGKDELSEWAKARPPEFWISPDGDVLNAVRWLMTWAQDRVDRGEIFERARNELAGSGELWLVATAMAGGHVVVTREKSSPDSKKRLLVPDVCAASGVPCEDFFVMLRDLEGQAGA